MDSREKRSLIRNAKKGLVREDVLNEFSKLSEKERRKLVSDHCRPICVEMSPGKFQEIVISPAKKENQFFAFLSQKFGRELGPKLMTCLIFSDLAGKEQEKWIRRSDRVMKSINRKSRA